MAKKICVIGGSGVVGSHVVQAALKKGYKVNATLRNPEDDKKSDWLKKLENADGNLSLFPGDLNVKGSFDDAVKLCEAVVICALPESPSEPKLIETVDGGVKHILRSCKENGVKTVVITSSTGSTNPKEGQPPVKHELEHWSDPDFQISKGKYSPAAKTLMEKSALKFGEENPDIRIVIFNPSMILGPMFQPEIHGSLNFFKMMLKGDRIKQIPNDSMSFIDVRDLAQLEMAAIENPEAKGRYFGVVASYHWKEIVDTISKHYPEYKRPPCNYEGEDVTPTAFDHTRKNSLGVNLRGLDEIIGDAIQHLKKRGDL